MIASLLRCTTAVTIVSSIHAFGLPPLDYISVVHDFLLTTVNINAESTVTTATAATVSAYSLCRVLSSHFIQQHDKHEMSPAASSPTLSFLDLWKSSQLLAIHDDERTMSCDDIFANSNVATTTMQTSMLDMEGNPIQPLSDKIVLTPSERELFRLIMDVRTKYTPSTTIRVAGGWVRNKLIQRRRLNSKVSLDDIDFVLSDCSGRDFAHFVYNYVQEQQQKVHHDDDSKKYPNIVCSKASTPSLSSQQSTSSPAKQNARKLKDYNDTQAQHLQTASLTLGTFSLDFCQMRFEKYDKDSRVPTQTFAARAVQDAFRRDLTINALYYNLNTNRVEDWTERGIEDLYFRNIVTPMPPRKALVEDPLRILRAIRFAAQLSFSIDPSLLKAGSDLQTRNALVQKVSSVRIGNEVDGIFQSADPTRGVGLLLVTRLMDVVFDLNDPLVTPAEMTALYQEGYHLLFRTQTLASKIFQYGNQWDEERRRYLWYAAFLKPINDNFSSDTSSPGKGRQTQRLQQEKHPLGKRQRRENSVVHQLLTKQLARPMRDVESVENVLRGAHIWYVMLENRQNCKIFRDLENIANSTVDDKSENLANLRLEGYKLLKRIGPLWQESLFLSLSLSTKIPLAEAVQLAQSIVKTFEDRLGLETSVVFGDTKVTVPLLNGGEIQKYALPNLHGHAFREVMQAQEEWQVCHCWDLPGKEQLREIQKKALIDFLIRTFPQHC